MQRICFEHVKALAGAFRFMSCLAIAWCAANTSVGQTIRTYQVEFTTNNIIADGIDSPGEWDGASTGGDGWNELRQPFGDADTDNNEFRMLWDETNLYVRLENDFDDWLTEDTGNSNPDIDFGAETLNMYFDPNTTGEPNNVSDSEVDGYQLSMNTVRSSTGGTLVSTDANRDGVGFYTEAHVDGLFGNQANWGGVGVDPVDGLALQDMIVAQNNQNSGPSAGGFIEMVIPWTNFNADAQIDDGAGGLKDTGLNHPFAPSDGDVWFANLALINNSNPGNFLPIWNWTSSDFFASHGNLGVPGGHGELVFNRPIPEPSTMAFAVLGSLSLLAKRAGRRLAAA